MIEEFKQRNGTREIRSDTESLEIETKVSRRYTKDLTPFLQFWKSLRNHPPQYGADQLNSLFDKGTAWNLSELKSILNKGMEGNNISGVTQPYLYVGVWRSLFGWHKEDLDLYSINYLHSGAPKFWYTIDLDSNQDFEDLSKRKFGESFRECPEFLRHKTTLIEPTTLIKNGVKLYKIIQKPREFVIARTAAYHAGFNSGFNIAEAVNFAMPSWLDIADNVSYCKCSKDSVKIDMDLFRKRLRGEPVDDVRPAPEVKRTMCKANAPAPKA